MQRTQYRFKFYFNASHAIYLSGEVGQSHPHTWELVLSVMSISEGFVLFDEVEKMCENFLLDYQDVHINSTQAFKTINPTLENICLYFKDRLEEMLYEKGWLLLSIELSETPSRAYMISVSDEMEIGKGQHNREHEEALKEIMERMTQEKADSLAKSKPSETNHEKEQDKNISEVEKRIRKSKSNVLKRLVRKLRRHK